MKGLNHLTKKLDDLAKFLSEIDGKLGTISYDPFDAESIEHAIVECEKMIDNKSSKYSSNQEIQSIAKELKAKYRQGIIDKAAEARIQGEYK
ncbi:hypothetical protein [Acinetobacter soli]|uniref:hypothetical protein n=1 Tax=Acinetobacter soli TaxID=487316 RepID=UPI003A869AC1